MLTKVDLFEAETKKELEQYLGKVFLSLKYEERSLASVIEETLNHRQLFEILSLHLEDTEGLPLGRYNYWDDAQVEVKYGLAIKKFGNVKRTTLYAQECIGGWLVGELELHSILSGDGDMTDISGYPTPESFRATVNEQVLSLVRGKAKLIDLRILAENVHEHSRKKYSEAEKLRTPRLEEKVGS